MRSGTIALLLGVLLYQQLPQIPSGYWAWLLLISLPLTLWSAPIEIPLLRVPLWLLNGFLITHLHVTSLAGWQFDPGLMGRDLTLTGVVESIPEQRKRGVRFNFRVERLIRESGVEVTDAAGQRIRLTWYGGKRPPPTLEVGERWNMTVRLKLPHGFMNPGGYDYEATLFRKGIRATGYVKSKGDNRRLELLSGPAHLLHRSRADLALEINRLLPDGDYRGIITALGLGIRDDIDQDQWRLLLNTGTNHLVAISGLHIGLIAGFMFLLVRGLWQRSERLLNLLPAVRAAAVASIIAAFLYAALAGFSIPTQRALVMVVAFMLGWLLQRYRRPSDGLFLALLVILVIDPLAVMEGGFWLSFAAVAIILISMSGRLTQTGLWWKWGRVHWVIGVALLPLTLFLFDRASLISPLANFVAVPWVSCLVVPLVLIGVVFIPLSDTVAGLLLSVADTLMAILWPVLAWLEAVPYSWLTAHLSSPWILAAACIGVLLMIAPRGFPGRALAPVWLAALLFSPQERPQMGEAWLDLLDVGQGLAAVVRTHQHTLLFDTGPRFSADFDAGSSVVVPFLKSQRISELDALVISHGDNDHAGGSAAVLEQVEVKRLLSSSLKRFSKWDGELCRAGQSWQWDGVMFQVLHPTPGGRRSKNNASCVIKVSNAAGSILLTGDIEKEAERQLLDKVAVRLRSDVLVVPHHGSLTSSTPGFVKAVAPEYVLFPTGYGNRYKLPKAAVVERYRRQLGPNGADMLATGWHGAIHMRLTSAGEITPPEGYRNTDHRYWHHLPEFSIR